MVVNQSIDQLIIYLLEEGIIKGERNSLAAVMRVRAS